MSSVSLTAQVGALTTLMAVAEGERGHSPPEVFPLLLFALTGMVLLAAASDLLVVFIALEILSLALYIMAGANRRATAQELAHHQRRHLPWVRRDRRRTGRSCRRPGRSTVGPARRAVEGTWEVSST